MRLRIAIPGSPRRWLLSVGAAALVVAVAAVPAPAPAQEKKPEDNIKKRTEEAITRGLDYLKKIQAQDGHFEAQGGAYTCAMTGLAGMAFLMEGSTLKEGKYSDQIKKTAEWFLAPGRQQP